MALTTNVRRKKLEELDSFLNNSKKKFSSIVSALGWSIESISKNVDEMVVCPFNKLHSIPAQSLLKHLEECQWKAEGYGEKDLPLSSPSLPPGSSLSIKFDEQLQDDVIQSAKRQNPAMIIEFYHCIFVNGLDKFWYFLTEKNDILILRTGAGGRLIPRTSDRLIAEFTKDERLAMYEYVIANTAQPDIGEDITDMNKPKASDGKTSSYLELLAQERNLKRRRAKYRGVHTNKKSQVEILREVINQQMEMLAEYISEKNDNEDDDLTRNQDTRRVEISRNSYCTTQSDRFVTDKSISRSGDGNDRQHQGRTSTSSAELAFHSRRSSTDRGYDQDSYEKNEFPKEKSRHSDERSRRVSSDRISHTSSHKSHKHRSKDRHGERHKRHKLRDREKSRSSRETKRDERHAEDSRRSKHDDRWSKKRRRSRDR